MVTHTSQGEQSQVELDDQTRNLVCERVRQLEAQQEKNANSDQIVGMTYASHLSLNRQAKLNGSVWFIVL